MGPELLRSVFSTPEIEPLIDARAWVQAMLDFEAALARAQARAGVIPPEAADVIAAACQADRLDIAQIGRDSGNSGNPAIPLVKLLTAAVEGEAAGYVHWGATSQDVIDTGMMLILRQALDLLIGELQLVERNCAGLADRHRDTVMAGRTLLQQALPTTFGLKAAGWLSQLRRTRLELERVRHEALAVQFGGAVGTLASLGDRGLDVLRELAQELQLAEPDLPWHTARDRVARVASALALVGGALGKIAVDVALLMQTEVAEVAEPAGDGRGGSSTMPHKRNPVASTMTIAAVRQLHAIVPLVHGAMLQEHERAAGSWHAEWQPMTEALRLTAAAVRHMRGVTAGLTVDAARMRRNLELTDGLLLAEAAMMALAPRLGRDQAHRRVQAACRRAVDDDCSLKHVLAQDKGVLEALGQRSLDALFDPAAYLGEAQRFIERALSGAAAS